VFNLDLPSKQQTWSWQSWHYSSASIEGERFSPISSMSASRSAQLLETDRLLWLVLDYGTVCHQILLRATRCHGSVENSNHFYLDSHIPLFCFSFLCDPCGFYLGHAKNSSCNVMFLIVVLSRRPWSFKGKLFVTS